MESSAFDEFLKLGGELQADYGHMFNEEQIMPFDGVMDGDSLSLLLSDLDAPCSTPSNASSYSGMASQSASSSPTASHTSSNSFPYQDMLSDSSSPFLLESPPPQCHESFSGHGPVMPGLGGPMMMNIGMHEHYESYASPSGTYSSSDDSGHHSPATSYDLESGCYDYGSMQQQQQQQPPLQRRSSSEDSCGEFAAPVAPSTARRALRLQQASPPAADPPRLQQTQQQPPARVVYVLPPQQQQAQKRPAAAMTSSTHKVAPPLKAMQDRPPQQQIRPVRPPTVAAATPAAAAVFQPVVVKQQTVMQSAVPKTTVLLARTTPCVQFVSSKGTALMPIKLEPKEEVTQEEDIQYFRKQEDRKQKNRAAAQQSRLRRRCELDELRSTVGELSARNQELQEENGRLKKRVQELESHGHWAPPRKRVAAAGAAATCLMVFVMMFAFQTTPLDRSMSPFSLPIPVSRQISEASVHSRVVRDVSAEVAPKTRKLLAIEDYDQTAANHESAEMAEYAEKLARSRNETRGVKGCDEGGTKRYPNQTENILLHTDVNKWVESHDLVAGAGGLQGGRRMFILSGLSKRRLVPSNETESAFVAPQSPVQVANKTKEQSTEGKRRNKKKSPSGEAKMEREKVKKLRQGLDMVSPGLREHGPENRPDWSTRDQSERINRRLLGGVGEKEQEWRKSYERLAAAVQQKPDTLYVVAMKDYLLLPALDRNATSRPRVSLILPAVMNGTMTTANNQIMLMRLDLDVVGTELLHLAEGLLPIFHNLSIY